MAVDRSPRSPGSAGVPRDDDDASGDQRASVRAHAARNVLGPWLPEPVDTSADPTLGAERGEALELAVLVLLERLSPTERAAFVLREAFNYPYKEIAEVLRVEEANARQLVTRARQHVTDERRAGVSSDEQKRLLHAFVAAAQTGDLAALERLFTSCDVWILAGGWRRITWRWNGAEVHRMIRGDRAARRRSTSCVGLRMGLAPGDLILTVIAGQRHADCSRVRRRRSVHRNARMTIEDLDTASGPDVAVAQIAAFREWEQPTATRFADLTRHPAAHPCRERHSRRKIPVSNSYRLIQNLPNAGLLAYPDSGTDPCFSITSRSRDKHPHFSRQTLHSRRTRRRQIPSATGGHRCITMHSSRRPKDRNPALDSSRSSQSSSPSGRCSCHKQTHWPV